MMNLFASIQNRLRPSGGRFMGDVYQIVGGTGLAQLLIALSTPVISRLFSESAVGVSTLSISITLILSTVANLRYDVALLLPEDSADAVQLLRLSLLSILLVAGVSGLGLWAFRDSLVLLLQAPELQEYLLLVPVAVAGIGLYQTFNSWNTRTRNFWRISIARLISTLVTLVLQIGVGIALRGHPFAMILGFFAGYLTAGLFLGVYIGRLDPDVRQPWDWGRLWTNLYRYRKFPMLDTWANLISAISWQVPPLLLAGYFSTAVAGSFAMAYRLIQLPVSFIGVALSQVFSQRAASVKDDPAALEEVTRSTLHRIFVLGLLPAFLLTVIGRDLFVIFLGANWEEAGLYVQILGISMFFWFASYPLGTLTSVKEKQDLNLLLQILLLVARVSALVVGGFMQDARLALVLFSASGILVYALYDWLCLRIAGFRLRNSLPFILRQFAWAAGVTLLVGLAGRSGLLSPPGMLALGGAVFCLYFWVEARKLIF